VRHAPRTGALATILMGCSGCLGWPAPESWGNSRSLQPAELWYAGTALCGFSHEQLKASARTSPEIFASTSSLVAISDVAMDATGNVWVVGPGSDKVLRFSAEALRLPPEGPNTPVQAQPDLVIQSAALKSPGNLAFDADGALWVANRQSDGSSAADDGSVVKFDIPIGQSGMQVLDPTVRITSTKSGDLFEIGSIAFDGAQNLWLTSFVGLLRFDDPRSRTGDVALTPSAVVEKTGYPNNLYFYSVAFDAGGALWAASSDGLHYLTSVTEFKDPGSLNGRSSPAAAGTITGEPDLLPAGGLAFDSARNLWMATGVSILMYSEPGELSGMANPAPAITLDLVGKAAPSTNTHLVLLQGG
jgi:hypothetical protein